jgi:hypothetical protein
MKSKAQHRNLQYMGSLSEALPEPSGELGRAVTESLAVFSKERLVYLVVYRPTTFLWAF